MRRARTGALTIVVTALLLMVMPTDAHAAGSVHAKKRAKGASVTATLDEQERRWYAVLHLFDGAGRHRSSRIEATGTAADGLTRLDDWLAALPGRRFADIAIGPFSVHHEGQLFGLVVEEDREWVELYPDRLGFSAPWDGLYDT